MKKRRVKHFGNYWLDIIFGGFVTLGLIYLIGYLYITRYESKIVDFIYFFICLSVAAYYQWKDDNYELIETDLSKAENFRKVTNALDNLGWDYKVYKNDIGLTYNKYILKFLSVRIMPEHGKIYYNFQYYTFYGGRLPFFFGISSYLESKFVEVLKKELNDYSSFKIV